MDFYTATAKQKSVRKTKLPRHLRDRILADSDSLASSIRAALSPYSFEITAARDGIQIDGCHVALTVLDRIFSRLTAADVEAGGLDRSSISSAIELGISDALRRELEMRLSGLPRVVHPKSLSQVAFMQTFLATNARLIFGIGPTGTGKTFTAIAAALAQLESGHFKRIIITRPHTVMDGEVVTAATRNDLDYDEQFEYLEDVLIELEGYDRFHHLVEKRQVELMPLGHLRGRTFNDSFIIIDDAQNMSVRRLRMAVTRMGYGSRMVITGDPSNVDMLGDEPSGLGHLLEMLIGTDIATVHRFEKSQIIRDKIVARIEDLYDRQANDPISYRRAG